MLAHASESDWAHAQLLAVRLPWSHRTLAQAIGRLPQAASVACSGLPQAASGACPGHGALAPGRIGRLSRPHRGAPPVSIYAALIGRTPNRYGREHSQATPGALPVSMQATRLGALPVLRCCLPAVCHKWSDALLPQAHATTRHSPRLGALPSLRWQRERLQCQRHLASVYAICPAGLAPWLLLVSISSRSL